MTKADWLDFLKPSMVVQRLKKKLKPTLAAGEFQDDAPAVETAPTQEAPAQPQPTFASAQKCNHSQLSRVPKKRNHSRLSLVPRSATTADFCECPRSASASSFCKCSG